MKPDLAIVTKATECLALMQAPMRSLPMVAGLSNSERMLNRVNYTHSRS